MTFRIADTFSDSLARLTAQEQKAVKTAAFDLQMNPANPGLSMHRVDRARDPGFWTARAGSDIRLVLHKRDGDTLLAWVGHHDAAYRWAETRRIDAHPRTGAAQIVEIRETVEEVIIQRYVEEAVRLPRLFANESDETLLSWAVPEDWLDMVREATEDTVLDIAAHLPAEAGEALLQAATGTRPEPAPRTEDPYAHPDAARRFRVMENETELAAALEAPWEKWAVFLHPAQREFVERDFNGPARVIGSAGTGKTVVALHRAVRLAREDANVKVLLTTFNQRLVENLSAKCDLVALGDVRRRIKVATLSEVAEDLFAERFGALRIASDDDIDAALENAAKGAELQVSREFLREEWDLIFDAWNIDSAERYRELPRLGRRVRMAASRRDDLWAVFAKTREGLASSGVRTRAMVMHELARELGSATRPVFGHVLVDEAQDISVPELHLLAAMAGNRRNGLFFAGDIGQRIFRAPFPWKAAGVDIRGRSRSLKVNYRTTEQIRRKSDLLLPESILEADGNEDRRDGVVSLFDGPMPSIREFADRGSEARASAKWLREVMDEGVTANEIVVLVRSNTEMPFAREVIEIVTGGDRAIDVMDMHGAKGTEYRAVVILACDQDVIPSEKRLLEARDEASIDEIMATERHLLYVAATRAREFLWVSGVDPISEFLRDLD